MSICETCRNYDRCTLDIKDRVNCCSFVYPKEENKEIRNKAIDEFAHQLKESLNQEFPSNYESTRPYFTLENARILVDEIAKQMKGRG